MAKSLALSFSEVAEAKSKSNFFLHKGKSHSFWLEELIGSYTSGPAISIHLCLATLLQILGFYLKYKLFIQNTWAGQSYLPKWLCWAAFFQMFIVLGIYNFGSSSKASSRFSRINSPFLGFFSSKSTFTRWLGSCNSKPPVTIFSSLNKPGIPHWSRWFKSVQKITAPSKWVVD